MILTEQETIALREHIKARLSHGYHEVVFEKANGSIRHMTCTRDNDLIDYESLQGDSAERAEPVHYIRVFDFKVDDWRSFRFDKLISIDGIETERVLQFIK